jgi:hypothetical protein
MSIVVPSDGLLIGVLDVLMMVDEYGSPMGEMEPEECGDITGRLPSLTD